MRGRGVNGERICNGVAQRPLRLLYRVTACETLLAWVGGDPKMGGDPNISGGGPQYWGGGQ